MKLNKKLFVTSLALVIAGGDAMAAGYSTELTSTSGLANSYAGSVTGIHDVSDMFFNPAILSDVENGEFVLSASYLDLKINTNGGSKSDGTSQTANVHDAGVNGVVPALYVAKRINEDAVFGLAITSPFGLATRYTDNWQGSDRAIASSITTININPSVSYKVNKDLSLGAGFQAQYYRAQLTSSTASTYYTKVQGSDWGYGFNLGAKYQATENLKFGIGYRSKIDHNIVGTVQAHGFGYSDMQAKTSTPESLTIGTAYKLNPATELAYDLTWTRWSRLKSLQVHAYQNSNLSATSSFNWHDSFLHSVGANFTLNDKWLLRTGLAYEKEAMTDANRNPAVPASDKVWTSIGFNYKFSKTLSVDATYLHQFYRNAVTNLKGNGSTTQDINVHYKTKVDVFSLALKKEF